MTKTIIGEEGQVDITSSPDQTPDIVNHKPVDSLILERRKTSIETKAASGEMLNEEEAEILQSLNIDVLQPMISLDNVLKNFLTEFPEKVAQLKGRIAGKAIDLAKSMDKSRSNHEHLTSKHFFDGELSETEEKEIQSALNNYKLKLDELTRIIKLGKIVYNRQNESELIPLFIQSFAEDLRDVRFDERYNQPTRELEEEYRKQVDDLRYTLKLTVKQQSQESHATNNEKLIPKWWEKYLLNYFSDPKFENDRHALIEILSSTPTSINGEYWLDTNLTLSCGGMFIGKEVDHIPSNLNLLKGLCLCSRTMWRSGEYSEQCPNSIKIGNMKAARRMDLRAIKEVTGELIADEVQIMGSPELKIVPYIKSPKITLIDNLNLTEITIDLDAELGVSNCPLLTKINRV